MILEGPDARVVIDPAAGGRVTSVLIDGWEVLVSEGTDEFHWGNFVVAPWAGRLRNGVLTFAGREHHFPLNAPPHALHGLVTNHSWREVRPGVVVVDLPDPWPWSGRIIHTVELGPGRIQFRLTLEADEPMPAAMGWHPWFARRITTHDGRVGGPVKLDVEPGRMWAHADDGVPTGELVSPAPRPWDFCFRELATPPRLRWPGVLELEIRSDCEDWVIYDREAAGVCVEPWTAPPNSPNLPDPTIVVPERPLTASMTWLWRRLD